MIFSIFEGNVCLILIQEKKLCFFHFWGQKVGILNFFIKKHMPDFLNFQGKKCVCFFPFWKKKCVYFFKLLGKNVPAFSNFGWKSLPTLSYFGRKKYLNFPVLKKKIHCLISPILSKKNVLFSQLLTNNIVYDYPHFRKKTCFSPVLRYKHRIV